MEFAFVDSLGDIVFNSIRKSDDTLDSSPLEVSLIVHVDILLRFLQAYQHANREHANAPATTGTGGVDYLSDPARLRELSAFVSPYLVFEAVYFDGGQPFVYAEDPPFIKAAGGLDSLVHAMEPMGSGGAGAGAGAGHRGKKKAASQAGGATEGPNKDMMVVHASVQRAFPLSSSHQGRPFRLAAVLCVPEATPHGTHALAAPAGDEHAPKMLVAFSQPFKVLAKQGTHGSKPKLVHPSLFERISAQREAAMRAVLASAAVVRQQLVPQDRVALDRSAATVDASKVHPHAVLLGVPGIAGSPEPPAAVVAASASALGDVSVVNPISTHLLQPHPSDAALPVPVPEPLKLLEARLGLQVAGAPPHIPAGAPPTSLPPLGHGVGQALSARAPRPKRPAITPRSGAQSDGLSSTRSPRTGTSSADDGEGTGFGSGPSKRPRRSAAVAAEETIRRTVAGEDTDSMNGSTDANGAVVGAAVRVKATSSPLPDGRGARSTLEGKSGTAGQVGAPTHIRSAGASRLAGRAGIGTPPSSRDDMDTSPPSAAAPAAEGTGGVPRGSSTQQASTTMTNQRDKQQAGRGSKAAAQGQGAAHAGRSTSAAAAIELAPSLDAEMGNGGIYASSAAAARPSTLRGGYGLGMGMGMGMGGMGLQQLPSAPMMASPATGMAIAGPSVKSRGLSPAGGGTSASASQPLGGNGASAGLRAGGPAPASTLTSMWLSPHVLGMGTAASPSLRMMDSPLGPGGLGIGLGTNPPPMPIMRSTWSASGSSLSLPSSVTTLHTPDFVGMAGGGGGAGREGSHNGGDAEHSQSDLGPGHATAPAVGISPHLARPTGRGPVTAAELLGFSPRDMGLELAGMNKGKASLAQGTGQSGDRADFDSQERQRAQAPGSSTQET